MTPEAWCSQMAQQASIDKKTRVRFVPGQGFFRVYWLKPRKEVGPFPTIERAWLAPKNYYRAAERFEAAMVTYSGAEA